MRLQALELVVYRCVQDPVEGGHCRRLKSAAGGLGKRVVSAEGQSQQSPTALQSCICSCLHSKACKRKSVAALDACASGIWLPPGQPATQLGEIILPSARECVMQLLRIIHYYCYCIVCLPVSEQLCLQQCVRHVLRGEEDGQHRLAFRDHLAAMRCSLIEEEYVDANWIH